MKIQKVIISISISIVLIVAAFGFYVRQRSNITGAPSTAEITQPSSTPQLMQPQPELSSSPISVSASSFVLGHDAVTQPNTVSYEALPQNTVACVFVVFLMF